MSHIMSDHNLSEVVQNIFFTQKSCTRPKMSSVVELGVLSAIGGSKSNVSVEAIEGHLASLPATPAHPPKRATKE